MKLIYFLPAPGFRVKHGMTTAGPRGMRQKECLFTYVVRYNYKDWLEIEKILEGQKKAEGNKHQQTCRCYSA